MTRKLAVPSYFPRGSDGRLASNIEQRAVNLQALADAGVKRILGRWDIKAPEPFVDRYSGQSYTIKGLEHNVDHIYRLIFDDGRKVYVSEPYGVDLDRLAELDFTGWTVDIGTHPLWLPGGTTPILFERAA